MSVNIEMNMKGADGAYEQLYPRTLGDLVQGKVSQATNADTATQAEKAVEATRASTATTAGSAGKITTARSLKVNLSSTSSQSFDGSSDATSIGVSGTLGVSYGGTGVTSYSSLASNLNSYISAGGGVETMSFVGNGTSGYKSITFTHSTIQVVYMVCSDVSANRPTLFVRPNTDILFIETMRYPNRVTWYSNYIKLQIGSDSEEIQAFNQSGETYYCFALYN